MAAPSQQADLAKVNRLETQPERRRVASDRKIAGRNVRENRVPCRRIVIIATNFPLRHGATVGVCYIAGRMRIKVLREARDLLVIIINPH